RIKFGYQELVDAIADAIEKSEELDGAQVVDKQERVVEDKLDFNSLMKEAHSLWNELVHPDDGGDAEMAKTILKKIEIIFGHPTKISEITEDQVDLLQLVILDMKDLLK